MSADDENLEDREPLDVLDDHLRCRAEDDVEGDLRRNFATDVRVLSGTGMHHGHDGVRECANDLANYFPNMSFDIKLKLIDGDLGYIEWTASGAGRQSSDGADSFVIRGGKIVGQTIHYSVEPA